MSGVPDHAGYDVLELAAMSYAQTAVNLGVKLDATAPFTIDAWIKLDGLCASASILSQDRAFSFGVSGESLVLSITGRPVVRSDPRQRALTSTDWHHVAVTFTGDTTRMFIDGTFNVMAAASGTGTATNEPFLIGKDLQAHVRSLRVFNAAIPGDDLRNMMFQPPVRPPVADFDFSVAPPVDRGPGHLPVALASGARMLRRTPALELAGTAFAQPLSDQEVNPGGRQTDPYTVQAWVRPQISAQPRQFLFVNGDPLSATGMALYLTWDSTAPGYRVVSRRGGGTGSTELVSTAVLATDAWTNIATTFDGVTSTIYLDGQPAGTGRFGPVPLASEFGRLLIGAAPTPGHPFGLTTFQGHLAGLQVWSRALTADEIRTYQANCPPAGAAGLAADYDFTTRQARNLVDAHPVGLADGALLAAQVQPAAFDNVFPAGRAGHAVPAFDIPAEQVDQLCASIDAAALLRALEPRFREAMETDLAAYAGDADGRRQVGAAWQEVLDRIGTDPRSLPFFVTAHVIDGEHVLLCHRRGRTHVAYRVAVADIDECTLWKVQLIFVVVGGVLDAFFGLTTRLSDAAIAKIASILRRPRIATLLTPGAGMTASGVFALATALYQQGFLMELLGMVVELGFWAVLRVAGKLALKLLGVGAADTIASLVATAATFIVTYLRKPTSCTALPTVDLSGIAFDYDPTSTATDALSIRRNLMTEVPKVQWTKANTTAEQSPAAYAISKVTGKTVTIQARFLASNTVTTAEIKADGGGALGAVDPITVKFRDGRSDPAAVTISLPHHKLAQGGVRREDIQWSWSYRLPGGDWQPLTTTAHRIYVLLDLPTLPWQLPPGGATNQQPWTEVLDYACAWAQGTTTATAAATAITQRVNSGLGLSYETDAGATKYVEPNQVFLCSQFLDLLRGGIGLGRKVNCTDCATIVTAFANILGCHLLASMMYSRGSFTCNKIKAIGDDKWAFPFGTDSGEFSYHEVAWTGAGSYGDPLFDACLKVDIGPNPWDWTNLSVVHEPGLPAEMPFTTLGMTPTLPITTPFTAQSYRERLATNDATGIGRCVPRGQQPYSQGGRRRMA